MKFEPLHDGRYGVGEGPVWDADLQRLFWVDITGKTVHVFSPATGESQSWASGDFPTALAIARDGKRALVALAGGMAWLDLARGAITLLGNPDTMDGNRLNEGKCDPQGRFWTGSMQSNLNPDGSERKMDCHSGALFRVDPDGSSTCMTAHEFGISNTLAWAPDGRTMYFADTLRNAIFAYDWDADEGHIFNRRVHLEGFDRGAPDGSAMDADGCLWNARFGGSCLIRITPRGEVDQIVEVPVTNPTSCTFGGEGLGTLFVTSAQFTLSEAQLANNPLEGAVLSATAGVSGVPDHRFGA